MINPSIKAEAPSTSQSSTMETVSANCFGITGISQANLNNSAPLTADAKGLDLIKYVANKARLNQKPTDNEIKTLTAATNAMEKTRDNFRHIRVNVHASQDSQQLAENARKLRISRYAASSMFEQTESIAFHAAIAEQFQVGNCGEYSSLDYIHFIENICSDKGVSSADILMRVQNANFFENSTHVCNAIRYKSIEFKKVLERTPIPHWTVVEKAYKKSIIMDAWAYGPAVLEEDYQFNASILKASEVDIFPLKDSYYAEDAYSNYLELGSSLQNAAKEIISNLERERKKISQLIPNVEEYCNQDHSKDISTETFQDLGQKFMCDERLLQAPSNSLQSEINFVVAAKDVNGMNTKDAVKLFKTIKFSA